EHRGHHGRPAARAASQAARGRAGMKDNRTRRAEVRMEPKRVVVDLQQLDLLEQKIVKATELLRSLRREKDAALARVRELEKALTAAQTQIHASEKGKRSEERRVGKECRARWTMEG